MANWGFFVLLLSASVASEAASGAASAGTIEFRAVGVNQEVIFEQTVTVDQANLGALSDEVFTNALASGMVSDYQGCQTGVLSLDHLGNGIEVLSHHAFNAYGWCFLVDGHSVNVLANDYQFSGQESVVEWFYAYDQLVDSRWDIMCNPATHLPPPPSSQN